MKSLIVDKRQMTHHIQTAGEILRGHVYIYFFFHNLYQLLIHLSAIK